MTGVVESLKRLEGVQNVMSNTETMELIVAVKRGDVFQPASFRSPVEKSDYKLRYIKFSATGEAFIDRENNSKVFSDLRFRVGGRTFPVLSPFTGEGNSAKERDDQSKQFSQVRTAVEPGVKKVTIVAQVRVVREQAEGILIERNIEPTLKRHSDQSDYPK